MEAELMRCKGAGQAGVKPVAAVVGGAKVSSKLDVLTILVNKVDHLIIGGGMANTFLAARGVDVGKSLCEHDLTATAEKSWTRRMPVDAPSICPMMWWWRRSSRPIRQACAPATSTKWRLTR
jgi:3-phosphoglycerate kinase